MKPEVIVKVEVVEGGSIPARQSDGAAGFDLAARTGGVLGAGGTAIVPAGFKMELPVGYEAQIRPRSGLAVDGVTVLNSPGTIDSDYRGEVGVILHNTGPDTFSWEPGDRIAQMVVKRIPFVSLNQVESVSLTDRGEGGFGSTGVA